MDPRIGTLNGGKFYAYPRGYAQEPVIGALAEVEAALGIGSTAAQGVEDKARTKPAGERVTVWDVTLTFECPSWDETDGILYPGVVAMNKSEAIRIARRQAQDDGHAVRGRGKYWFSAVKSRNSSILVAEG